MRRFALAGLGFFAACSNGAALPVGSVDSSGVSCPADAPAGATCAALTIHCSGLDDIGVVVVASEPSSAATATILLHDNVGGEKPFDYGFVDAYHAAGFRVVQTEWQSDWEAGGSVKRASCRYATMLDWVFTNLHGADRTHGFCAQSWGGGSGGLALSLADYDAAAELDAVTVTAGPPFARVDLGCTATSPPTTVCGESVPVAYSGGPLTFIAGAENAPTCGAVNPPSSEIARWESDSVLGPGASLSFPRTSVAAWYCAIGADATVGQGALFFDALTTESTVHCVTSGCAGEAVWPAATTDIVADMTARCVPRH